MLRQAVLLYFSMCEHLFGGNNVIARMSFLVMRQIQTVQKDALHIAVVESYTMSSL